jgi:hypothetical protein
MDEYEKAIDEGVLPVHRGLVLNDDDVLRKAVIMEMMSNFKLNIAGIEKAFGIDFFEYFADAIAALAPFVEEDLVVIDKVGKKILVNTTGTQASLVTLNLNICYTVLLKRRLSSGIFWRYASKGITILRMSSVPVVSVFLYVQFMKLTVMK